MTLAALHPREASIFACLTDTVVRPAAPLPPVAGTDAVAAFDRWMARAPRANRLGVRALLYATEVAPLLAGFRRRLRRLSPAERERFVGAMEHARAAPLRQLAKLMKGMSFVSYYGDDAVLRQLGYDAEANLARGRALRRAEGRA